MDENGSAFCESVICFAKENNIPVLILFLDFKLANLLTAL